MGQNPPWADLPPELLSAIASFLSSDPIDNLRFRAVCKPWYSSSSLSSPVFVLSPLLPMKIPCPPSRFALTLTSFFALSVTVVYSISPRGKPAEGCSSSSSNKTWVAFVDQVNPGKLSIRYPLLKWPASMTLDFPRGLNLLDFHVSEVGRFYNLSQVHSFQCGKLVKPGSWSEEFLKVVFLSSQFAVIVVFEDGKLGVFKLGGERIGVVTDEWDFWDILHDGKAFRFDDAVECNGRVLGIDRRGRVYEVDDQLSGIKIIAPSIKGGGGRRKRLIVSCGILHLVVRNDVNKKTNETGNIKVYRLNEDTRKWIAVPNIGDQIFFFGVGFSFSASSQEFEGFSGRNCVIYGEHSFRKYEGGSGDSWFHPEPGLGSLKVGVYHLEDGAKLDPVESYPCYSDLLWPPPAWIWLDNRSRLLRTLEVAINIVFIGIRDKTLKAKYEELSSLVKSIVLADDISQQDMQIIRKERGIIEKFMNEIESTIDRDFKALEKSITEDLFTRRAEMNSAELPNQIKTSDHGAVERHGCASCFQKAIEDLTGEEELVATRLVARRLEAHVKLKTIFVGATEFVGQRVTVFREYSFYRGKALEIASSSPEKLFPRTCLQLQEVNRSL